MTANRSIFASIKSPFTLLFLGGVVVGLGGMALYTFYTSPYKTVCVAPVSYYTIEDNNNATLARGIYRFYRDSLFDGHSTYVGSISHYKDGKLSARPTAVNREVRYDAGISGKRARLTLTNQHRKLGDQSSNQEVQDYIFPHIDPGDTSTSTVYILDDTVLASGSESVARIACTN